MRFTSLRIPAAALAVAAIGSPGAWAQGPIHSFLGDSVYDGLGRSVSWIGDLNGDGRNEVLAGAPLDNTTGLQDGGMARVYNGASGAILYTFYSAAMRDEFGTAVAGVGDVNGDGTPDWAVGAPYADINGSNSGQVTVYSGANGTVLYTFNGDAAVDAMGYALAYLGDVDGDSRPDILVGCVENAGGTNSGGGYVRVYSGATGAALYTVSGATANNQFGYSLNGGRDVDNDGRPDWAVGIYGDDTNGLNAGAACVFSGASGTLLYTVFGDSAGDRMGSDVALIGDVSGDGRPDFAASAREDDNNGTNSGLVRLFDGPSGALVASLDGFAAGDRFGYSLDDGGDYNGDGWEDVLVGAAFADSPTGIDTGAITVLNGRSYTATGSFNVLQTAYGVSAGDLMGYAVANFGTVNNDTTPDYGGGGSQYGGGVPGNGNGVVMVFDPTVGPPPPPARWPNLPASFVNVGAGYTDTFESYAGTVPAHMAVNELESLTRVPDSDAWCNIGQNAPVIGAFSGVYALEMGGNALGMSTNHDVSNGLVIGLNGNGASQLLLDFRAYNYGEENSIDDGVWVSQDGTNWEKAYNTAGTSWNSLPLSTWTPITGVDLSATSVNVSGQFYLLFAEQENTSFGVTDGIVIDDVRVTPAAPPGPFLSITPNPPVSGQIATVTVINNNPGDIVRVGFSLVGGGPLQTTYGTVLLSPPIRALPAGPANAQGVANFNANVPITVAGRNAWLQALNYTQSLLTNGIAVTIQ